MKRLLLLGDSIRMGYEPYVRVGLAGRAEVVAPAENGRFAKYTLWGVNLWIAELGRPDVVHWNNGLWDFHREAPRPEPLTSVDEYVHTLDRILEDLRRTGAAIVFATTTPVGPGSPGRTNEEIDTYNAAAVRLMTERGVAVDDLNAAIRPRPELIAVDTLHLTDEGYQACAEQVIHSVGRYL